MPRNDSFSCQGFCVNAAKHVFYSSIFALSDVQMVNLKWAELQLSVVLE